MTFSPTMSCLPSLGTNFNEELQYKHVVELIHQLSAQKELLTMIRKARNLLQSRPKIHLILQRATTRSNPLNYNFEVDIDFYLLVMQVM